MSSKHTHGGRLNVNKFWYQYFGVGNKKSSTKGNVRVDGRYSGTDERIEALEKELESCRKQALFEKETTQAAISTLRQSQYETLSQLQVETPKARSTCRTACRGRARRQTSS